MIAMSDMSLYFFSLSVSELELSEGHLIESSLKAEVTHPYAALYWRVEHNTVLSVSKGNVNEKSGKTLNQSLQDFVQNFNRFLPVLLVFIYLSLYFVLNVNHVCMSLGVCSCGCVYSSLSTCI